MSKLEKIRRDFKIEVPDTLKGSIALKQAEINNNSELKKIFPNTFSQPFFDLIKESESKKESKKIKVGIVFSGGPAAGGHNVIWGLFDKLIQLNPNNELIGFLDGPSGIINNETKSICKKDVDSIKNQGGFDFIGSGRTKIETQDQLKSSLQTVKDLNLDGLVVVGGDDSNTNAAVLAEYFLENSCNTKVVGVPKTIDGDLKNDFLSISFGFDTACKVYSELIGNLQKDALSSKKYYHFIKLMGRSASHIALECALKTQPNLTIIGEEVNKKNYSLNQIVSSMSSLIIKRSKKNKNYGVFLIPEGLIEFIPEIKLLIEELNNLLSNDESIKEDPSKLRSLLSDNSKKLFFSLPIKIQKQFLLDRDPHGNIQLSHIETEKLLAQMVKDDLMKKKEVIKFNPIFHFFGYEGRCAFPSNFDATYCYCLGLLSIILISNNITGYMSCIYDVKKNIQDWKVKAVPLISLINLEQRLGKNKPVIKKHIVDLNSKAYDFFIKNRGEWMENDYYLNIGPMQFFSENKDLVDSIPNIVYLNEE